MKASSGQKKRKEPRLRLRAHHLLCIQGFRGYGYSQRYVDNLSDITARLRSTPDTLVKVITEPDAICPPCPFLTNSGCAENGADSERRIRLRDRAVLSLLGLKPKDVLPWSQILPAIAASIPPRKLDSLCLDCQWLELGYCKEGLEALAASFSNNVQKKD